MFDAAIGRFLSADPHIQFAGNLQNYNRYSYVNNNPLSFNDPSGYFIRSIFKALKALFKKIAYIVKKVINVIKKVVKFIKENWRVVVAVVVAIAVPIAAGVISGSATTVTGALAWVATSASLGTVAAIGAIAGGLSSLITTGSLTAAFKGAVFGAVTGAVAFGFRAGNVLANTFGRAASTAKVAAHGLIGGLRAKVDGMSFSKGFLSAAVAKALTPQAVGVFKDSVFLQGLAVATVGGIASSLAGGSFEHGFLAAGVAFATNYLANEISQRSMTDRFLQKWVEGKGENYRLTGDEVEKIKSAYINGEYDSIEPAQGDYGDNGRFEGVSFRGYDSDLSNSLGKAYLFFDSSDNLVGVTDWYNFNAFLGGALRVGFFLYEGTPKDYFISWGEYDCKYAVGCGGK